MLAALSKLEENLNGLDAFLVNVIHDEFVVEALGEHAQLAKNAIEKAMTEGMLTIFPHATTINLVEAHIGTSWADAK